MPSPGRRIAFTFWKTCWDDEDEAPPAPTSGGGGNGALLNPNLSASHRPNMAEAKLGAVLRPLAEAASMLASFLRLKLRMYTGPKGKLCVMGMLNSGRLNSWTACSVMEPLPLSLLSFPSPLMVTMICLECNCVPIRDECWYRIVCVGRTTYFLFFIFLSRRSRDSCRN